MPTTLNTVREFVIDSLKKYHGILTDATDVSLKTTLADFVSKDYAATTYLTKADAGTTYLSKADAATTYITYQYAASTYVAKDGDKVLSTNDFTDAYKTKLEGIEANAEVNVNADWTASSGDAQILNKPNIEALFGYAYYDSTNHKISFSYSSTSAELYNINCSDFIIDGMIDSVSIEQYSAVDQATNGTSYLFIDFNTDAQNGGHTDIKIPLNDIFNPDNYYTKTEVDTALSTYEGRIAPLETAYTYFTSAYSYTLGRVNDFQQAYTYFESAYSYTLGRVNDFQQAYTYLSSAYTYVMTGYTYLSNAYAYVLGALLDDEETWAAALNDLDDKIDDINNYGYITNVALADYPTYNYVGNTYIAKETGKGLSTNDFTDAYETKLTGIETGAQVNVIEEVQLNGTALQVTDKSINIQIPAGATVSFTGTKDSDAGDYTYVANGFSANDHEITVSYTGVLKQHQDISGKEDTANKKTDLTVAANISNTYYPTTYAVASYVGSLAELTTNELNDIFGISNQ